MTHPTEDEAPHVDAEQARLALEASRMGTWRWSMATGEVVWDETLEAIYGLAAGGFDGRYESYLSLIHPDDRDASVATIQASIAGGGEHRVEHRVVWPDGSTHWVAGWGRVTRDAAGEVDGLIGVAVDITPQRQAEERLREQDAWIRRLQNITASISGAASIAQIAGVVIEQACAATGADAGVLCLLDRDGGGFDIVGQSGFRPGGLDRWLRLPLDASLPLVEVARTGVPIWGEPAARLAERYESFRSASADGGFDLRGTVALVPLVTAAGPIGAMALRYATPDLVISFEQQEFLLALAGQAAQAFDRARLYESERDARETAEEAEARLAFLSRVSEVLSSTLDPDEALRLLADLTVPRIAEWCAIETVEPDGSLRNVTVAHPDPARAAWARAGRLAHAPSEGGIQHVVRTGTPVFVPEVDDALLATVSDDEEYVRIVRAMDLRSVMIVPLHVHSDVVGAMSLFATGDHPGFGEDDLAFAQEVARRASVALENARLHEAERAARRRAEVAVHRLEQLQAITEAGLTNLGLDDALERMLAALRTAIRSDSAAVLLLDERGGSLAVRAALGVEGRGSPSSRVSLDHPVVSRAAVRGETVVVDDAGDIVIAPHAAGELGSLAVVPLRASGRILGVLHAGTRAVRPFTQDDLELLHLAAERVAVAVDRAQLFEREHRIAETLQRSLLPERLPDLPGVELAARYVPGSADAQVGGDWYEVVPLTGGRLSAAVGDVVGRGIRAAAAMGQFRNAMRALALEGLSPGRLLDRLSELSIGLGREFATATMLELDPATGIVSYSSAGHPPALVLPADGVPWFLDGGRSTPLGVEPGMAYPEAVAQLAPGTTTLLYTDGLIERRGETLESGLERLRRAAASEGDPERLVDRLLEELTGERRDDDVAILAIRYVMAPTRFELRLPSEPRSVARFRSEMKVWLEDAGVGRDEVDDVVLAVSEACSNAVEHAGVDDGDVVLAAEFRDADVVVAVRDAGRWQPPHLRFERGRGFRILRALMDDVQVSRRGGGTEVRMRRRLGERVPSA